MKRIIICLGFISMSAITFGQQTKPSQSFTSSDYLQKSKHQKTAAWIMLAGGAGLAAAGVAVDASNWNSSGGDVLLVIGGASILGSVPLFIASGKNKRKGMAVSGHFQMEPTPLVHLASITNRLYPAVSLKIDL